MFRTEPMPRAHHLLGVLLVGLGLADPSGARAEINNPPLLLDQRDPVLKSAEQLREMALPVPGGTAEAMSPAGSDRLLNLKIQYIDSQLYNPATATYDKVRLRGYTGKGVDPDKPYVSPTILALPGDTVRVNLDNQLPAGPQPGDPGCMADGMMMNTPHCFNGTNLHTHGLWVSPAGNSDNVLLSINPQTQFTYEYNIPTDHPSGTFWYHTHRHGSTALQVSSGMAGALIIRGDRPPTPAAHGDLDTLIPTSDIPERILVMQQIQYACRGPAPAPDKLGPIKTDSNGHYLCDPGDVGGIEGYDQFGPNTWPKSGRYTSLNGEIFNPDRPLNTTQGRIERWRMIHAGVRDTISLQFFKVRDNAMTAGMKMPAGDAQSAATIDESCGTTPVPYMLVAADGLTLAAGQMTTLATFQPGYRFDALVVFPEAGQYCVIDSSAPGAGVVNGLDVGPRLLAVMNVESGAAVENVESYVTNKLIELAEANMPGDVKAAVVADLEDGAKLTSFTPHPDVTDAEVAGNGTQELTFFIDTTGQDGVKFEVGNALDTASARPYDPSRIDRKLPLGKAQTWVLQSQFVSHPFHIHVNPFQIVSIIDPSGKDVSALGSVDDAGGTPPDPQYPGLKGVWKDTLWIKSLLPGAPTGSSGLYTITVRTRYQRYIGEFVLHCHILDHEDQGMMQNVEVVLAD